jgi:sporulation protein YlmC with PRC-barrel domain
MQKILLILMGSTAVASIALAQAPPSAPAAPAPAATQTASSPADCDRLETFLEQRHPADPGVTLEQVRSYRTSNNVQACHDALMRLEPNATRATTQEGKPGADTSIVVQQPTQSLRVEQAPPQVTVQQQQPQVTVRQPQPDITVRQPAPTVTVDIPQPEIIIRMPKPEVNVAMLQPQVQVNQPPPRVQVTQPPQQPEVQVQPAEAQVKVQQQAGTAPNVQIQESNTQPTVHFERGEPKVVVNQAQGQPHIRVEQEDAKPQTAESDRERTTATTGAAPSPRSPTASVRPIQASRVKNMVVYNEKGARLGEVERIVQAQDGKQQLIVGVGGFLGLGERRVAIPSGDVAMRGDRLILENLTEEQLKRMPPVDRNSRELRDIDGNATIELSSR